MLCSACAAQDGLSYSRILPILGSQNDTAITAITSDAAGNISNTCVRRSANTARKSAYATSWSHEIKNLDRRLQRSRFIYAASFSASALVVLATRMDFAIPRYFRIVI